MKKTLKTKRTWIVVGCLAVVLAMVGILVYADSTHFWDSYKKTGTDYLLERSEWNNMMKDLDELNPKGQDCPECPACDSCCSACVNSYTAGIESKDRTRIIPWTERNMGFYKADGTRPKGALGLSREASSGETVPCGSAYVGWKWSSLGNYAGSSTKLCAVLNTSPCTSSEAGSYYVNVGSTWYSISISCLNIVSGTPYVSVSVGKDSTTVNRMNLSMEGYSSFPFSTWSVIKS